METSIPVLDGIVVRFVRTPRLFTRVLLFGDESGEPVLFLHGNLSSATWWEETMIKLPPGFFGIAPDQRGFGQSDSAMKTDATRGLGDYCDDAIALLDTFGIARAHIIGNSLGGSVIWRMLMEHPDRLLTATVVAPGSPFGFGGTKDISGTPCFPDFAGSGAGLVNRKLAGLIAAGDRSVQNPFSPRSALRALVFKPPFIPVREEDILSSLLTLHLGEKDFPGDFVQSPHWPYKAPGVWGAGNALSPKYAGDISRLNHIMPKIPILWIRGSHDASVSDAAASDAGRLGQLGLIPGWPGSTIFPSQPMIGQTRAVLQQYAKNGGSYREVVIEGTGHVPFIEKPDAFNTIFHPFLKAHENA